MRLIGVLNALYGGMMKEEGYTWIRDLVQAERDGGVGLKQAREMNKAIPSNLARRMIQE